MNEIIEYYLKIFLVTFSIGLCARAYFNYKTKYFSKKGLQCYPSFPLVGCLGPLFLRTRSFPDHIQNMYNELKPHKIAGMYDSVKPAYFITDPDILKQILIKNFDHFVDRLRAIPADSESVFGKNLMSLTGLQWHAVRATLSPAFTASKMKNMFVLMNECGDQMVEFFRKSCKVHHDTAGGILSLEMKDVWSRFATDVIGTTAYGVKVNSMQNPKNEFFECGKAMTYIGFIRTLSIFGHFIFPNLMKMLGIPLLEPKSEKYFATLIKETLKIREEQGIVRPDMIHLLMQARKGILKSEVNEDDDYHSQQSTPPLDISDDHIIGQAVIFFFAGFDTISSVLSFASYFLAMNPEIQKRVQDEISSVLQAHNNELSYETIQKMKYLHMVLSETLRRACIPQVDRRCVKDFVIPATESSPEVRVEKGEGIWIPVYGLHHDPEYFPNPEKFDPERFNEENIHNIKPFTYLPFGMGPRNCLGMRFGLMEVKIALIRLLSEFSLCRAEKTPERIVFSAKSLNLNIEGGFWVGIFPRKEQI